MTPTYTQREKVAAGLAWRRDLAIECGLWQTAVIYERRLAAYLRPGERLIGRQILTEREAS